MAIWASAAPPLLLFVYPLRGEQSFCLNSSDIMAAFAGRPCTYGAASAELEFSNIEMIIVFCFEMELVILADEVYQEKGRQAAQHSGDVSFSCAGSTCIS